MKKGMVKLKIWDGSIEIWAGEIKKWDAGAENLAW